MQAAEQRERQQQQHSCAASQQQQQRRWRKPQGQGSSGVARAQASPQAQEPETGLYSCGVGRVRAFEAARRRKLSWAVVLVPVLERRWRRWREGTSVQT
uniref:Uncharacterized protein n=1 Tax=Oryza nivara TaxID=4536 RepID=A0A0E0HJG6_ORYNI